MVTVAKQEWGDPNSNPSSVMKLTGLGKWCQPISTSLFESKIEDDKTAYTDLGSLEKGGIKM